MSNDENTPAEPAVSKARSRFQKMGILAFGTTLFFVFLLMKLPEARIQNLAIAYCRIFSQSFGLLFSAEKVSFGVLPLPALRFYNIELKAAENEKQLLKIPYLKLRPRLLPLLVGSKKAGMVVELLNGEISGTVGMRTSSNAPTGRGPAASKIDLDFSIDNIDLAQTSEQATLLQKYMPASIGGGILNGSIDLSLDFEKTDESEGRIKFDLEKANLPPQNLYGFNLPRISISSSQGDISISKGQIIIRKLEFGQSPQKDDIVARITGDGQIGRSIESSRINTKVIFELSQGLKAGLSLLDALIGNAKTPDGKYSLRMNGMLIAPQITPGG